MVSVFFSELVLGAVGLLQPAKSNVAATRTDAAASIYISKHILFIAFNILYRG